MNTISLGAEERLLTRPFKPYLEVYEACNGKDWRALCANRCYMQVIHPKTDSVEAFSLGLRGWCFSPAEQYEALCERFGSERVNRAIRNRILNNQLWRAQVAERDRRKGAGSPVARSNREAEPAL